MSKPDMIVAEFDYDFEVVPKDDGSSRVSGPPGFTSPFADSIDPVGVDLNGENCVVNTEMASESFMECIVAPQNCSMGFSFSIWLKLNYPEGEEIMTLFTTGKDLFIIFIL